MGITRLTSGDRLHPTHLFDILATSTRGLVTAVAAVERIGNRSDLTLRALRAIDTMEEIGQKPRLSGMILENPERLAAEMRLLLGYQHLSGESLLSAMAIAGTAFGGRAAAESRMGAFEEINERVSALLLDEIKDPLTQVVGVLELDRLVIANLSGRTVEAAMTGLREGLRPIIGELREQLASVFSGQNVSDVYAVLAASLRGLPIKELLERVFSELRVKPGLLRAC